ncbi:hypothetical protein [Methanocaldococcus infernus]|uniref:Uncharacterized protein n=1 Tax=Methanocaldococcus infernus (strain DSM 11812 / JCM 15783 / ME) TaxID=573063 RepID=D5VSE0_METIM|nr:hypothetical protein [Methanocaldococcus infernus]ADG13493.1 hypothetical protein Metin_0828 [Methanocaldococcus infernus ME]
MKVRDFIILLIGGILIASGVFAATEEMFKPNETCLYCNSSCQYHNYNYSYQYNHSHQYCLNNETCCNECNNEYCNENCYCKNEECCQYCHCKRHNYRYRHGFGHH